MADEVAIVTGGGSGLGRAAAVLLARAGRRVVVADVNAAGGNETIELVKAEGADGLFVRTDTSREEDVAAMVEQTVAEFGRLDLAFNNAGIVQNQKPIHEMPLDLWNRVIGINLTGIFLCMKHEIPHMLKQGKGAIVNTSSVSGVRGFELCADYCAAKSGVNGLTQAAAVEYGKRNIRVNSLLPGPMPTGMLIGALEKVPGLREHVEQNTPIGRFAEVEEVAAAAVWLLSDAASYVTGSLMAADGGMCAAG